MNSRPKALQQDLLRAQAVIFGVFLSAFPSPAASRHADGSGELHDVWHGQSLPYSQLPLNDALPGSRSFRVGRLPLVRQRKQQYYCCLIYKLPVFRMTGASARWSRLHIPVETGTPPYIAALCAPPAAPPRRQKTMAQNSCGQLKWVLGSECGIFF